MAKPTVNPNAAQKIDTYISTVPEDQKPILTLIRSTVRKVDDRLQEDWKWNAPCYNLNGLICWFMAFKSHVGINFFKGAMMEDKYEAFVEDDKEDKGNRMIHYTELDEVDTKIITDYVNQAILLNDKNIKLDFPKKKTLKTPDYFREELSKTKNAEKVFENFTDAQRKDYIEWLEGAKKEETRNKRMAQAIEWIAEGKTRNWKYMKY